MLLVTCLACVCVTKTLSNLPTTTAATTTTTGLSTKTSNAVSQGGEGEWEGEEEEDEELVRARAALEAAREDSATTTTKASVDAARAQNEIALLREIETVSQFVGLCVFSWAGDGARVMFFWFVCCVWFVLVARIVITLSWHTVAARS